MLQKIWHAVHELYGFLLQCIYHVSLALLVFDRCGLLSYGKNYIKYYSFSMCFMDKRRSNRFGTMWGCVNNSRSFVGFANHLNFHQIHGNEFPFNPEFGRQMDSICRDEGWITRIPSFLVSHFHYAKWDHAMCLFIEIRIFQRLPDTQNSTWLRTSILSIKNDCQIVCCMTIRWNLSWFNVSITQLCAH